MRERKYRVWDKNRDKMLYFGNQAFTDEYCLLSFELITDDDFEVDGEYFGHGDLKLQFEKEKPPVMDYTGLKDKNGVDIYEGDILISDANQDCKAIVEYRAEVKPGFDLKRAGTNYFDICNQVAFWGYCEVIGNIYQNKELLK